DGQAEADPARRAVHGARAAAGRGDFRDRRLAQSQRAGHLPARRAEHDGGPSLRHVRLHPRDRARRHGRRGEPAGPERGRQGVLSRRQRREPPQLSRRQALPTAQALAIVGPRQSGYRNMASVKGDSFYDTLEARDAESRERELFERLRAHLAHARRHAPGCAVLLADIDPSAVTDRAALASLPVTRKSELSSRQGRSPPFGGLAAVNRGDLRKIFASPGPIYEPESARPNYWRMAR